MPRILLAGKRIGGFWTYPVIETGGKEHRVIVALVKGFADSERNAPMDAESVNVELLNRNEKPFSVTSRPQGKLPEVGGPSVSVNAVFTFAASSEAPRLIRVRVSGETGVFDVEKDTASGGGGTTTTTSSWFEDIVKAIVGWVRKVIDWISGLFGGSSSPRCCVIAFNIPTNRSGRRVDGNRLHESFNMNADFGSTGNCQCSCCEYRQYVRGTFTLNGVTLVHMLPSGALHPTTWREDGVPNFFGAGSHFFYGHRADPGTATDIYQPTRPTGCQYRGWDDPGIRAGAGDVIAMNLEFRGEIIDTCRRTVTRSATWTVNYSRP